MKMVIIGKQMVGLQGISYPKRSLRASTSLDDQCCQPAYKVEFAHKVAVTEDTAIRHGCAIAIERLFGKTEKKDSYSRGTVELYAYSGIPRYACKRRNLWSRSGPAMQTAPPTPGCVA